MASRFRRVGPAGLSKPDARRNRRNAVESSDGRTGASSSLRELEQSPGTAANRPRQLSAPNRFGSQVCDGRRIAGLASALLLH